MGVLGRLFPVAPLVCALLVDIRPSSADFFPSAWPLGLAAGSTESPSGFGREAGLVLRLMETPRNASKETIDFSRGRLAPFPLREGAAQKQKRASGPLFLRKRVLSAGRRLRRLRRGSRETGLPAFMDKGASLIIEGGPGSGAWRESVVNSFSRKADGWPHGMAVIRAFLRLALTYTKDPVKSRLFFRRLGFALSSGYKKDRMTSGAKSGPGP